MVTKIRTGVLGLAGAAGYAIRQARRPARFLPGMAGLGLISWGAGMIYLPAGLIVAGAALLFVIDPQIPRR